MKHVDYQLGVASKTKRPTAEERLNEASFLTIEPQGEVWTKFDSIYAVVDVPNANEWSIAAHFPLSPSWIVMSFEIEDRDAAFEALLLHKRSRPLYYRDDTNCVELHGSSVAELLEELRSKDISIDAIDRAKHCPQQEGGPGETKH